MASMQQNKPVPKTPPYSVSNSNSKKKRNISSSKPAVKPRKTLQAIKSLPLDFRFNNRNGEVGLDVVDEVEVTGKEEVVVEVNGDSPYNLKNNGVSDGGGGEEGKMGFEEEEMGSSEDRPSRWGDTNSYAVRQLGGFPL